MSRYLDMSICRIKQLKTTNNQSKSYEIITYPIVHFGYRHSDKHDMFCAALSYPSD